MKPEIKTIDLELTRTIPASPLEAFQGWLDPQCPGAPWITLNPIRRLLCELKRLYEFNRIPTFVSSTSHRLMMAAFAFYMSCVVQVAFGMSS
jgi:hypothetical protein